jgi:hypothetical protein
LFNNLFDFLVLMDSWALGSSLRLHRQVPRNVMELKETSAAATEVYDSPYLVPVEPAAASARALLAKAM